jgi:UDP-glucuronate decarboxylase
LWRDEPGRPASSAEYFVASPREVIDPKTTRVQSGWPDPNVTQGVGRQKRYVDNLLEAIVRMMGTSSEVTDPFGNPQKFTIPELAELIIEMTGTNSKIRFESLPLDDPRQRQTS